MPRTPRPAMFRTLTTAASSLVLLALTALPAMAASGTQPDAEADPYLVGSLGELLTTAIVGVVVAIIAWWLLPSTGAAAAEDEHH